jgi:hypothetical protein
MVFAAAGWWSLRHEAERRLILLNQNAHPKKTSATAFLHLILNSLTRDSFYKSHHPAVITLRQQGTDAQGFLSCTHASSLGLARTVYLHRIRPYVW